MSNANFMMQDSFSTPILLLIFNRPTAVEKVIQNLRAIKPKKIYVGADGPRHDKPDDRTKCTQTRDALKNIDWPCEIVTLFRVQNMGCRNAVHEAINWFFEHEESGIILEDDCVPDSSFFYFSAELLEKYKDNQRVMHIAGDNPIEHITRSMTASYTYTTMPLVWGWATWRTSWRHMNISLDGLENFNFSKLGLDSLSQKYLVEKFWVTQKQENDSWAYAWYFSILQNNGICILPKVNLVRNIGFNEESTHTTTSNKVRELKSKKISFPLIHPKEVKINHTLEQQLFHTAQKSKLGLLGRFWLPAWFRNRLRAIKNHVYLHFF